MPLTDFQNKLVNLLAANRSQSSHLAGGAALHFDPSSIRYSNDLDYFNDSAEILEQIFKKDSATLKSANYQVNKLLELEGFIRCEVSAGENKTKIEWSHDSAWRFLPPIQNSKCGYVLHPIDIAINKLLALAGRDEARDFIDIHYIHKNILPLSALCWAAVGKDPGFSPRSLFELIQRRGKYRGEDFKRLMCKEEINLQELKQNWLAMLSDVLPFFEKRNPENVACLYYSKSQRKFIAPEIPDWDLAKDILIHFGKIGGRELS